MILLMLLFVLISTQVIFKLDFAQAEGDASSSSGKTIEGVLEKLKEVDLPKSHNSSQARVVFVAGMEGTGHHMFRAIFEKCVALRPALCEFDKELPQLLFKATVDSSSISPGKGIMEIKHRGALKNARRYSGLFGVSAYDAHSNILNAVFSRMKEIASSASSGKKLVILNTQDDDKAGVLSYPNYDGLHRSVHNPDLHVLACVAEAAGVDFRVVVLQRSAEAAYASFHRRFHVEASLMGIVTSANVLYAQLTQIAPDFYHCVSYDDMGALRSRDKDALATFLHPALRGGLMNAMLGEVVTRKSGRLEASAENASVAYHLVRYQSILDKISGLCRKRH
jgi:hypothetical protein